MFFFFKQKTAYEMRISDWSSDVCSSDLHILNENGDRHGDTSRKSAARRIMAAQQQIKRENNDCRKQPLHDDLRSQHVIGDGVAGGAMGTGVVRSGLLRSEEHTSELQSLMRLSYAVFCLKKKRR